jgi:hypothetical protein
MATPNQISSHDATELQVDDFMSADDLRDYMTKVEMAKAEKALNSMDKADQARQELIKRLSTPISLTETRANEIVASVQSRLKGAASRGEQQLMVMRFPNLLCNDKGRAINMGEAGWPETLIGVPRQAYELWRDRFQPAGFGLSATIIDWPDGMPGDVGLFVTWGEGKKR